jgi:hypothetical protein
MSAQRCMAEVPLPWNVGRLELQIQRLSLTPVARETVQMMHTRELAAAAAGAWRQRLMAAAVHRALHISGKPTPQRCGVPLRSTFAPPSAATWGLAARCIRGHKEQAAHGSGGRGTAPGASTSAVTRRFPVGTASWAGVATIHSLWCVGGFAKH